MSLALSSRKEERGDMRVLMEDEEVDVRSESGGAFPCRTTSHHHQLALAVLPQFPTVDMTLCFLYLSTESGN